MRINFNIVLKLFVILLVVLVAVFYSILIYDYLKTEEVNNEIRNYNIIINCIPTENWVGEAVELIRNDTHIFQPQTCIWYESATSSSIGFEDFFD